MMLRLKQKIRKMNKTFFIFSSIPKVKHYCLFHENTKYNINRFVLQCEGDFTWRVSDWWRHLRKHLGRNETNYFMY